MTFRPAASGIPELHVPDDPLIRSLSCCEKVKAIQYVPP